MEDINVIQQQIIEDFDIFSDWLEKYDYLIELGKEVPQLDPSKKTEQNLIQGCQSKVWLDAELNNGIIYFTADSDAIITKGIISLLIKVYNGRTPDEIIVNEPWFIDKIGLKENLSPTRANGLVSMIKQMKLYALAYKEKLKK